MGRQIAAFAYRNERFKARVKDRLTIFANYGVLDMKKLEGTVMSKERVFTQLRSEGIRHLRLVKRFYLEDNGAFSLVKEEVPVPGFPCFRRTTLIFLRNRKPA